MLPDPKGIKEQLQGVRILRRLKDFAVLPICICLPPLSDPVFICPNLALLQTGLAPRYFLDIPCLTDSKLVPLNLLGYAIFFTDFLVRGWEQLGICNNFDCKGLVQEIQ